ncbi:MAG: DUF4124 domain-containing protein [Gammaproteobacteria bacterium]|nr:DUF4124 domain-containing protein [Gammaproteobacteria bacterium]
MRRTIIAIVLAALLPVWAFATQNNAVYRWVDKDGVLHYGDSVPAEYAEVEKQVINDAGVTVAVVRGKKTDEEIAEELRLAQIAKEKEKQRRDDSALLATYQNIDEIVMHRDRRVELFKAQARVTELYLKNIKRRLDSLMEVSSKYRPYSSDPDAEMIDPDLVEDINVTRKTIGRHEMNLSRFQSDEEKIVARFDGDINRFKKLKGIE